MVSFVASIIVGLVIFGVPFAIAMRRRPVGAPLSWGQAMVGAGWAFFLIFWFYGVVPNQWLLWADNELNWRPDKILEGPGGIIATVLPFTVNYEHLRDLIAVVIYVVALAGNVAVWFIWQRRGERPKTREPEPSRYGRPLVKA